jgi:uncharacterized membrane protein required for colicin V production
LGPSSARFAFLFELLFAGMVSKYCGVLFGFLLAFLVLCACTLSNSFDCKLTFLDATY